MTVLRKEKHEEFQGLLNIVLQEKIILMDLALESQLKRNEIFQHLGRGHIKLRLIFTKEKDH